MAKKKRHKSRRPKTQRHKRVPNHTKELAIQLKSTGMTYNDVAKHTNLGYSTVEYICTKWAESNPDRVKLARARAHEEMAGKVMEKAMAALEHITPDSMTHDRVVQRNAEGVVTGVQHSGPNAQQLATTVGILSDKARSHEDTAARLRGENDGLIGPDDYKALIESIKGRVTRLTAVKADINTGEIQTRVLEIEQSLENEKIPADYEELGQESQGD